MSAFIPLRPAGTGQPSTGGVAGDAARAATVTVGIVPHRGPIGQRDDDDASKLNGVQASTPAAGALMNAHTQPADSPSKPALPVAAASGEPFARSAGPEPAATPGARTVTASPAGGSAPDASPAKMAQTQEGSPSSIPQALHQATVSGGSTGDTPAEPPAGPAMHCLHGNVRKTCPTAASSCNYMHPSCGFERSRDTCSLDQNAHLSSSP